MLAKIQKVMIDLINVVIESPKKDYISSMSGDHGCRWGCEREQVEEYTQLPLK